jgi:hypothetical protein
MSQVEFEPPIPVFEQAKTFRALIGAATVIGSSIPTDLITFTIMQLNKISRNQWCCFSLKWCYRFWVNGRIQVIECYSTLM